MHLLILRLFVNRDHLSLKSGLLQLLIVHLAEFLFHLILQLDAFSRHTNWALTLDLGRHSGGGTFRLASCGRSLLWWLRPLGSYGNWRLDTDATWRLRL